MSCFRLTTLTVMQSGAASLSPVNHCALVLLRDLGRQRVFASTATHRCTHPRVPPSPSILPLFSDMDQSQFIRLALLLYPQTRYFRPISRPYFALGRRHIRPANSHIFRGKKLIPRHSHLNVSSESGLGLSLCTNSRSTLPSDEFS
jgi:hypothetical protein